jgi:hypothetical protein
MQDKQQNTPLLSIHKLPIHVLYKIQAQTILQTRQKTNFNQEQKTEPITSTNQPSTY